MITLRFTVKARQQNTTNAPFQFPTGILWLMWRERSDFDEETFVRVFRGSKKSSVNVHAQSVRMHICEQTVFGKLVLSCIITICWSDVLCQWMLVKFCHLYRRLATTIIYIARGTQQHTELSSPPLRMRTSIILFISIQSRSYRFIERDQQIHLVQPLNGRNLQQNQTKSEQLVCLTTDKTQV